MARYKAVQQESVTKIVVIASNVCRLAGPVNHSGYNSCQIDQKKIER